jgi:hypothetical protein
MQRREGQQRQWLVPPESQSHPVQPVDGTFSPPPSLYSLLTSASPALLSHIWLRCIARSQWRRGLPSDVMSHIFSFLDPVSLIRSTSTLSKHWSREAWSCIDAMELKQVMRSRRNRARIKARYRRLNIGASTINIMQREQQNSDRDDDEEEEPDSEAPHLGVGREHSSSDED